MDGRLMYYLLDALFIAINIKGNGRARTRPSKQVRRDKVSEPADPNTKGEDA
jgi:hypothetical protein